MRRFSGAAAGFRNRISIRFIALAVLVLSALLSHSAAKAGTWSDISPAGYSADIFRDVYFFDNSTGIVVGDGGIILKTTDGGTSWSPITSGTTQNLLGVHFYDANNGFSVGSSSTALRTVDGGDTWSDASSGLGAGDLSAVVAISGTEVYASSNDGNVYKYNGATWSSQTTDASIKNGISGAVTQHAITVGTGGGIFYTTDGSTWNTPASKPAAAPVLYGIHAPTGTVAYAIGAAVLGSGTVWKTIDGGVNWTDVSAPGAGSIYAVHFVDANNGFATGDGDALMRTTNGGITWSRDLTPTSLRLNGIHAPVDMSVAYAVGASGTI
ncbi:MAG: YCF48-related protein, partial [Gammaproteobacteria bacterium]|nr:YCF48-related protein [Gammaproteobacteria bacterium]